MSSLVRATICQCIIYGSNAYMASFAPLPDPHNPSNKPCTLCTPHLDLSLYLSKTPNLLFESALSALLFLELNGWMFCGTAFHLNLTHHSLKVGKGLEITLPFNSYALLIYLILLFILNYFLRFTKLIFGMLNLVLLLGILFHQINFLLVLPLHQMGSQHLHHLSQPLLLFPPLELSQHLPHSSPPPPPTSFIAT